MVAVATVNPPGARYEEMAALLQQRCEAVGLAADVLEVAAADVRQVLGADALPRYNVLARWDVGAPASVHFNAHYDVVPAAGRWRSGDPFAAQLNGGQLYGRGTSDMKGSIAALLLALEALQRTNTVPRLNVECSFTADEETGGSLGAGAVVAGGHVHADYAVVCEGAAGLQVGCGHNGVLWLQVDVQGRAAHASRPADGVNAFEQMAVLVNGLQRYKRSLGAARRRFVDLDGTPRQPTVTLGGVFAGGTGDKVNTVPAGASFSIDRRLVPGESLEAVEGELRGTIQAFARDHAIRCDVKTLLRLEPCLVASDTELPQALARAVQRVRRGPTRFRVTTGFTDLHYFCVDGGLPGVGYGVKGAQAHGVDERIHVRELVQTARVYAELLIQGVAR